MRVVVGALTGAAVAALAFLAYLLYGALPKEEVRHDS